MRNQNTVLGSLLKAVSRKQFGHIVSRHEGDRYVKDFSSWDHLVTLIFAQLGGLSSLRELATVWNAQAAHHYHLGSRPVRRSTLSDANARRPSGIFAELFAQLSAAASRSLRREGQEVLRLLDATPIPLSSLHDWACCNGRTRGLKAHLSYDPEADRPVRLEITPATVNDVVVGRAQPIEPGATYVYDKAYVDYGWWHRLHQAGCRFVTRPKTNVPFTVVKERRVGKRMRQASIVRDTLVRLASQQRPRLPILLRRIVLRRDNGRFLSILTNDLRSSASTIAALYRKRWQIELLFRWIKQHLKIRTFLGRSENAIRLQLYAAMIAYLLLRIAARNSRSALPALRFAELVRTRLFECRPVERIDKPSKLQLPRYLETPNQLVFSYA